MGDADVDDDLQWVLVNNFCKWVSPKHDTVWKQGRLICECCPPPRPGWTQTGRVTRIELPGDLPPHCGTIVQICHLSPTSHSLPYVACEETLGFPGQQLRSLGATKLTAGLMQWSHHSLHTPDSFAQKLRPLQGAPGLRPFLGSLLPSRKFQTTL